MTTDPAAIDLEAIKSRQNDVSASGFQLRDDKNDLIAAVEALREREKQTLTMIADMLDGEMRLSRRAEAAEVRVVELVEALEFFAEDAPVSGWMADKARAALKKATP